VWFFHPRRHSRPARISGEADSFWWELHAAATAFGLHVGYIRNDIDAAFRRLARSAHPDTGGTLEGFQALVAQRDLLLKHLTDHGSPVEAEPASHPFNGAGVPF
jgi:hypothetical protein